MTPIADEMARLCAKNAELQTALALEKQAYIGCDADRNELRAQVEALREALQGMVDAAPDMLAENDILRAALAECVTETPGAACYNTGKKTRRLEAINTIAQEALARGGR